MASRPCIIPVSGSDAVTWAAGELLDRDLFLRSPLRAEAIFIADLPDHRAYRFLTQAALYWQARGAVCLIARTSNASVARHMLKFDAVPGLVECTDPVKTRYLVPPAGFARWCKKLTLTNAL